MEKEKFKIILGVFLYFVMLILGATIIIDLVNLIVKDSISTIFIFIIDLILIYLMVIFFSKTKVGKSLEKSIFRKKK